MLDTDGFYRHLVIEGVDHRRDRKVELRKRRRGVKKKKGEEEEE